MQGSRLHCGGWNKPLTRVSVGCFTGLAVMSVAAVTAQATIITYAPPPLVGADVTFPSVSESSAGSLPLYGTPTVSQNNLLFNNTNFAATSVDASPAVVFVDGQINITVKADAGYVLPTFTLSEFGDYNVSATPANPAAIDYVKVEPQAAQITVLAENGVALATPLVDNTSVVMAFSPSGGDFQTGVDPSTGSWNGVAVANLATLFGSNNITEFSISFDNQLLAESQSGGIATINKKGFEVLTSPTAVPEPTAALLTAVVGSGVLSRRRRI